MTLAELRPDDCARVLHVNGEVGLSQRLMEMGFFRGADLRVVRFAPLGDPMELIIHGYHLSLRRSEALRVQVEPCP